MVAARDCRCHDAKSSADARSTPKSETIDDAPKVRPRLGTGHVFRGTPRGQTRRRRRDGRRLWSQPSARAGRPGRFCPAQAATSAFVKGRIVDEEARPFAFTTLHPDDPSITVHLGSCRRRWPGEAAD